MSLSLENFSSNSSILCGSQPYALAAQLALLQPLGCDLKSSLLYPTINMYLKNI